MTGSQTLAPSVERTSLSSVQTLKAGRQRWVLVGLPYFIRGDFILWVWLGCKNPLRDESEVGEWGQQYQSAILKQMKCFSSLWCWPYKPRKPLRTSQHHTAFSAKGDAFAIWNVLMKAMTLSWKQHDIQRLFLSPPQNKVRNGGGTCSLGGKTPEQRLHTGHRINT